MSELKIGYRGQVPSSYPASHASLTHMIRHWGLVIRALPRFHELCLVVLKLFVCIEVRTEKILLTLVALLNRQRVHMGSVYPNPFLRS